MSASVYHIDPETLAADPKEARAVGKQLAEQYQSAQPYHYIGLDNFLPPEVLHHVLDDLGELPQPEHSYDRAQEKLKDSFLPERLPTYTRNLFQAFNSRAFIAFLEEMTGIKGLIPDPYFQGAGVHRVANGGHLDIHADFNLHSVMKVERRLNVLIYLNPDWKEEWGGSFEVWDKQMTGKVASFAPIFNRMCCFSTASDTFHGNPETVANPNGDPRLSIALYYYTATWDSTRKSHTTLFKPRPGTVDKADRLVARRERVQDLLPPVVYRRVAHHLRKIGL
tara:strand:+ start:3858 stop:4697 length:840 start_codon:yes stop_codon:yes gene_type:complete